MPDKLTRGASSPKMMTEKRKAAKAAALSRKHKHVMARLNKTQRAIVDHSLESNRDLYQSAHDLVPEDPIEARRLARGIKNNPAAMSFVDDARRLRLTPALELVARASEQINNILKGGVVCKECGGNVPQQNRDVLTAAKIALDAVGASGAVSQYSRAYEQDKSAKSDMELAQEILARAVPKQIATDAES